MMIDFDKTFAIVFEEPELPGPIPFWIRMWTIWMAFWNPAEIHRISTRVTKDSILKKLVWLAQEEGR